MSPGRRNATSLVKNRHFVGRKTYLCTIKITKNPPKIDARASHTLRESSLPAGKALIELAVAKTTTLSLFLPKNLGQVQNRNPKTQYGKPFDQTVGITYLTGAP